jgi:hypothetical protein
VNNAFIYGDGQMADLGTLPDRAPEPVLPRGIGTWMKRVIHT